LSSSLEFYLRPYSLPFHDSPLAKTANCYPICRSYVYCELYTTISLYNTERGKRFERGISIQLFHGRGNHITSPFIPQAMMTRASAGDGKGPRFHSNLFFSVLFPDLFFLFFFTLLHLFPYLSFSYLFSSTSPSCHLFSGVNEILL